MGTEYNYKSLFVVNCVSFNFVLIKRFAESKALFMIQINHYYWHYQFQSVWIFVLFLITKSE